MARGIARLVNTGLKVLIITHRDLLLAGVNNLLRLTFAGEDMLAKLVFEEEDCLSHEDVSAYRFALNEIQGGSFVHEVEIRRNIDSPTDFVTVLFLVMTASALSLPPS